MGETLKSRSHEAQPQTLPELHDEFMAHSALLQMAESGSETQARHSLIIDMILAETVVIEPNYKWTPPDGYYERITAICEKPKYVDTSQKKGLLK